MNAVSKYLMTNDQEALLRKYAEAVVQSPPHLHLTADREIGLFWKRHVLEAVALLEVIPPLHTEVKVLDIGSGNGIPGIPIAILRPSWQVYLLDSDNKKCGFLDTFCKFNAIENAQVIACRAEDMATKKWRESFNYVISRALAKLPTALELSSAYLMIGGRLIVPHGTSLESELARSRHAVIELGLAFEGYKNGALYFMKTKETPEKYPRRSGVPSRRPL